MPRLSKFVTLLNATPRALVDVWLLAAPEPIDLHWNGQRSVGCVVHWLRRKGGEPPRSLCALCANGVELTTYQYAAAVILSPPDSDNGRRNPVDAVIQLPLWLVDRHGQRLNRGRRLCVRNLKTKGIKPTFELLECCDAVRLPEAFDLAEALRRITGPKTLPAIPKAGEGDEKKDMLRGPWTETA